MDEDRRELSRRMDRAGNGDDDAFASLAIGVQDDLFRFCLAHGLGDHDAAEATQETLLRAYRARDRWRNGRDALAWMRGIALNVVRETRRARGRRRIVGDSPLAHLSGEPTDRPDARAEAENELGRLSRCVDALPERQREAVTCRFLRHMSIRETAEVMGCAEGTVKAAVHAALSNLQRTMSAHNEFEPTHER